MNLARAFFGALIVLVGTLFLLENLDLVDAGDVIATWWPLVLVAAGLISFLNNRRHWIVPLILVGGGCVVLLRTTEVVDDLSVIVPVLIIIVGLLFVFGRGLGVGPTQTGDSVNSFNLFSGSELRSQSQNFEGGRVGVLFGGAELDLRNATLADGATLDAFVAFGGVEISVPRGWSVEMSGFPIFGGYDDTTAKEGLGPEAPTLRIDATVLFGGLEVKH